MSMWNLRSPRMRRPRLTLQLWCTPLLFNTYLMAREMKTDFRTVVYIYVL